MFSLSIIYWLIVIVLCLLFFFEMHHSLHRSSETNRLIEKYIHDLQNKELIEEIYQYCQSDFKLRRIMKNYQITQADLGKLYQKLLLWGNFRKGRRFVPISSFFYVYTLEYLIKNKNEDAKKLTMRCMNFFHI